MGIIKARSPFFVSVTNASLSYATLDIEIYSGNKTTGFTGTPTYALSKQIITGSTQVTFEIAELIRDFLEASFDGDYDVASSNSCKWVRTVLTAFNVSDVQLSQTISTDLALDSYGYYEEGSGYSFDNKSLLMSNRKIYVTEFGNYEIPVYTGNNPTIEFLDSAGVVQRTESFTASDESDAQIKSVELFPELITNVSFNDASDWNIRATDVIEDGVLKCNGDFGFRTNFGLTVEAGNKYVAEFEVKEYTSGTIFLTNTLLTNISGNITSVGKYKFVYIADTTGFRFYSNSGFDGVLDNVSLKEVQQISSVRITDDNDIYTIEIKEQCEPRYNPYKVTFINKFGVLQDMYFFKKSTEKMTTKRESYKTNIIASNNSYNVSEHSNREFNIVGKESISLSSGFVNESYNEVFKQLMLSERVWLTREPGVVLPINIKTSNIAYKTSVNDRLVEYVIEFDYSYNVLNDIR